MGALGSDDRDEKCNPDNAEEILKSLTRQRNRIRQAAITKEISEIVGTAEALK
ncbi:MAG: F0F1 ATP synthase subunit gamma [Candidatus Omnitrophica bacterium]|nr:F0F1 ATP synthase subunit gamma [Candidatus Omnitrophota bacterium]